MENFLKIFDSLEEFEASSGKGEYNHIVNEIKVEKKPIVPIYKWEVDGTMCNNYDKYAKEIEYVSMDDGKTWELTGNNRRGAVIEYNSADCGYVEHPSQGVYLYSDMTYGTDIQFGGRKKIIGVCWSSNMWEGFARFIAIREVNGSLNLTPGEPGMPMMFADRVFSNPTSTDGKVATQDILSQVEQSIYYPCYVDYKTVAQISLSGSSEDCLSAPAAEACWRYNTDGTNKGDWFLPTKQDVGSISIGGNPHAVFTALNNTMIGGSVFNKLYWTSSIREVYTNFAYIYSSSMHSEGGLYPRSFYDGDIYVRPFLKLNFSDIHPSD